MEEIDHLTKTMKRLKIPKRFYSLDFKNHPSTCERWSQCLSLANTFFPQENLFMSGPCGTGKTSNAIAILVAHINFYLDKGESHHVDPRYFNAENLYNQWLSVAKTGEGGYLIESLSEHSLLILDDLGQGEISDSYKRWLYNLINSRWENQKSIIATTNLSSKEFRDTFGDALLSRLSDGKIWKFTGADHRLTKHTQEQKID